MSVQELLTTIQELPLSEQQELLNRLSQNLSTHTETKADVEAEVARRLLTQGIISEIPEGVDEEGDYEPVEITGKPVSEIIVQERR